MTAYREAESIPSLGSRLSALARLSTQLRGGPPTRQALTLIIEAMPEIIPADAYAVWLFDERTQMWHIAASAGLSEQYAEHTIRGRWDEALLAHGPIRIDDAASAGNGERRVFYEQEGIASLFVIPLQVRGAATGTLTCYYRTHCAIPDEALPVASLLADAAGAALSTRRFDRFAEAAQSVAAELDVHKLVQTVTDAATELTNAQFGAFFYNVIDPRGESYMLYSISGVPREAFSKFPMPRNTDIFAPTFAGTAIVRSADIRRDPNYGKNAPYHGMPAGHLPVVSYLAVPVISRTGEVLGGLFFGHGEVGIFTENEEQVAVALAAQASIGIDNARLYTALQQEREQLVRNEARYRSLVLASPVTQAIWVTNAAGEVVDDLPSWRELTGQTLEDIRTNGWSEPIHPEDIAGLTAAWHQAMGNDATFAHEFRLRLRDGSYRWFRTTGVPIIEDGRITEWVGTTIDIHDQWLAKQGAELLVNASEVLGSSLEYETTLRNAAKLVVPELADWCAIDLVDEQRGDLRRVVVVHVDPAKVEFAHAMRQRYPADPDTDTVARVIRTGVSEMMPFIPDELITRGARDAEHERIIRELKIMSFMVVPLRARGRALGAMTIVSSESMRRFTETDLRLAEEFARRAALSIDNARLYRDAQAANRAKDEFLATLSHELRTPMTAVIGWARMLKMGLDPDEAVEAVDAIEKSAAVQAQLIEDILDMSRIMAGKLHIETRPVDLRTVTNQALAAVHPTAAAKGVDLLTSFTPSEASVMCDDARIQQVVWNLLTNAIKFTPSGGRVEVRIEVAGDVIRLSVRDTGEGIDPSFLPSVFEPFRQQDSSTTRVHGGIGLGLAIVRRLVELHAGTIRVASEGKGRGATFVVELPRIESAAASPEQQKSAAPELIPLDGLTVLVIDDQEETREVLGAILRRYRAQVHTAASVREAMTAVASQRFDVILSDIAMPDEDGYAFLRQLRALETPAARTPVIAATAFGRSEERQNALRSGFDAYLQKPLEPAVLTAMIRDLASRGD